MMHRMLLVVLLTTILGIISGCTSFETTGNTPAPAAVVVMPTTPDPSAPQTIESPPVALPSVVTLPPAPALVPPASTPNNPATPTATLLVAVDAAIAAGELERAAALCERALRISPRDAYLWYRLASIHMQQQRYADAEGVARRALSFARSDAQLSQSINNLLQQAQAALTR